MSTWHPNHQSSRATDTRNRHPTSYDGTPKQDPTNHPTHPTKGRAINQPNQPTTTSTQTNGPNTHDDEPNGIDYLAHC